MWRVAILIFLVLPVYPQDKQADFNRVADELITLENDDDETDLESRYENLTLLLSNPVNLNKLSADDLRQFYFLSEYQIQQFIKYRREQGELLSVYELQSIPGFDPNAIATLAPLVRIEEQAERINLSLPKRMISRGNSYLMMRWEKTLEKKTGYSTSDSGQRYLGSDQKIFTRFRSAIPNDYSIGFTLEKDAGEKIRWDPQNRRFGGDHSSAHVQLINKGRLKNVILGDYQAQFGQAVVLGGSFGLGKGAETITTARRTNIGFVPHASAGESGFYRGIAATYDILKHVRLSAFISAIKRDASLQENENGKTVSAFQYSGLHRTENELSNERNTSETSYGTILHYRLENFDAGIILQRVQFSNWVEGNPTVYNQFAFAGVSTINSSVFYNYTVSNICLFGEVAHSFTRGSAILTGLLGSLTPAFDVSIVYRKYDRDHVSFYANPFSENTQPQNETGVYWGLRYKWSRRWSLAAYVDLFRFPWLAFRRYSPSAGYEWLGRLTFQPSRKISLFAQMRQELKPRNTSEETTQYLLADGIKQNWWASMSYAEGILRMRTRVQYSTYEFNGKQTDGIVLLQGLGFEVGKFQISGHYALFQTQDFDNRQYVYENDVYLAFSLPFYDGTGSRSMLMLQYSLSKALSFYLRYSRSYLSDREELGSGLETINGNTKNDIKFQTVFRF
ncbi:MAG TPA: helix-hairpin-helix domain-containing protein [Chryseosolibacter sp.]